MDALLRIEPFENFQIAANEVFETLHCPRSSSTNMTISAVEEIQRLLKSNSFNIDKLIDSLRDRGDEEKINYLITQLKDRKVELLYKTLVNYNTCYGECVTDFEWIVKFALGTSALKTLRHPFLQLLLFSTAKDGTQIRTVYEMKKNVVTKMINALESINYENS